MLCKKCGKETSGGDTLCNERRSKDTVNAKKLVIAALCVFVVLTVYFVVKSKNENAHNQHVHSMEFYAGTWHADSGKHGGTFVDLAEIGMSYTLILHTNGTAVATQRGNADTVGGVSLWTVTEKGITITGNTGVMEAVYDKGTLKLTDHHTNTVYYLKKQ